MPDIPKDSCTGAFLPLKVQVGLIDESTAVSSTALFSTKPQRTFHTWKAFRRLSDSTPPAKLGQSWDKMTFRSAPSRMWASVKVGEGALDLKSNPAAERVSWNQSTGSLWLPWELGQTSVQWDCLPQSNHGIIQLSFCWQHSRRQIVFSPVLVSIQNNSIHVTTAIPYLFLCN